MTRKSTAPKASKETEAAKRKLDDELDEALRDTFPASDPVELTQPDQHVESNPKHRSRH